MRLAVGLGVLALGVFGLGWLGRAQYAPYMQTVVNAGAMLAVSGSVHGAEVDVSGRDITVSGLADGPQERAALLARLEAVPGRRVVHDRLTVLPVVQPFTLSLNAVQGEMTVSGHVPGVFARDQIALLAAGEVTLAAGAPDGAWFDAALLGMGALRVLEEGQLQMSDRRLVLGGLARTPDQRAEIEAAFAQGLPAGYEVAYDLTYLDDGSPAAWRLTHDATAGARLEGKRPMGLAAGDMAAALGLAALTDSSTEALTGETGRVPPVLAALAPWLGEVETLAVSVSPEGTLVEAGFGAGADLDLLAATLGADLAGTADALTLRLAEVAASGTEGDRRQNAATGRDEVLSGGYWLPAADFDPGPATCAQAVDSVLAAQRIGFVTGSARLDARARSAVNALAGVLAPCLTTAGLRAEIGGHTDSTGSDEANLALSLARAQAVRDALLARGLPDAALTAEGYGAAQPVADNATEDGRAANRRTAVRWIE